MVIFIKYATLNKISISHFCMCLVSSRQMSHEPNWPSFHLLLLAPVAYFNVWFVNAIAGCGDSEIVFFWDNCFVEVDFHPHHHLWLKMGCGSRPKESHHFMSSWQNTIASVRCQDVVRLVSADTRASSAVTSILPLVSKTAFANVIVHPAVGSFGSRGRG